MKNVTTKVGDRRLLKLADFLDKLPRKSFNFAKFAEQTDCGTVACALGWCPVLFKRLGVKYFQIGPMTNVSTVSIKKGYDERFGFAVGEVLFGLTRHQSYLLFDPISSGLGQDATPKQVAKRIRTFIKTRK